MSKYSDKVKRRVEAHLQAEVDAMREPVIAAALAVTIPANGSGRWADARTAGERDAWELVDQLKKENETPRARVAELGDKVNDLNAKLAEKNAERTRIYGLMRANAENRAARLLRALAQAKEHVAKLEAQQDPLKREVLALRMKLAKLEARAGD